VRIADGRRPLGGVTQARHGHLLRPAGSTELGESLDAESLRKVISRYYDEMRGAIERHGGTVEKFIGDAVVAVFGIPNLHEDDAVRAVRAATEMREALAPLNLELEAAWGVRLQTRMGVNSGRSWQRTPAVDSRS
jgi:class 3 adenylate cyclase